ncbi:peptide deformylase [Nitratifractor sp.]
MVKELVVYPDDRILSCTDVRDFKDESLPRLLGDIRDTMEAHGLEALTAMQVAHPFNIVVIKKQDGSYWELINPRILKKEGRFEHKETTSYYPDIELTVPRYERISLLYEDRHGNPHSLKVEDRELAALIQQQMDFLAGGTPLDRVSKEYRERVLEALADKGLVPMSGEVCPTFSRKDYVTSFTDKILFLMGLSLLTPLAAKLFHWSQETVAKIYVFDKFAFPFVIVLMIVYFIYAQYEAKKYRQCSSCQIGNQIGIILKRLVADLAFAVGAWLLVNPHSPLF